MWFVSLYWTVPDDYLFIYLLIIFLFIIGRRIYKHEEISEKTNISHTEAFISYQESKEIFRLPIFLRMKSLQFAEDAESMLSENGF